MTGITSVWSSYGHQFLVTGEGPEDIEGASYERCSMCGGEWALVPDDLEDASHGAYVSRNGDEPIECPGLNDWQHGAYIENMMCCSGTDWRGVRTGQPCDEYERGDEDCGHWAMTHGCNCNICEV